MKNILLLFSITLLITSCGKRNDISGRITEFGSNNPIEGAKLTLFGPLSTTFRWQGDFNGDGYADMFSGGYQPADWTSGSTRREHVLSFGRDFTGVTTFDFRNPDEGVYLRHDSEDCLYLDIIPDVTGDGQMDFHCHTNSPGLWVFDGAHIKTLVENGETEIDLTSLAPLRP